MGKFNKGITLIALIITIIIMLILATVTIKIASDSGLFTNAEKTSKITSTEVAREKALNIVMKYYDAENGKIEEDISFLNDLKDIDGVYTVTPEDTIGPWIVRMKSGDIFKIEQNGTIGNILSTDDPIEIATNTIRIGDFVYKIEDEENRNVRIYGYRDGITNYDNLYLCYSNPITKGNITIPETIDINNIKYNVIGIGVYAFSNCSSITSVTIPGCVPYVSSASFYNCSSLKKVVLNEGIIGLS